MTPNYSVGMLRGNPRRPLPSFVRRHIDFVYAAALRQMHGDANLAEDVALVVFTDAARKAAMLSGTRCSPAGCTPRRVSPPPKMKRTETRRQVREQHAHALQEVFADAGPPVEMGPCPTELDEVLGALKEREREAVLLRFFEDTPLRTSAQNFRSPRRRPGPALIAPSKKCARGSRGAA